MTTAYPLQPNIHGDTIVFTAENDIWSTTVNGETARRLTNTRGRNSHPVISPDGSTIAFKGSDEGPTEIYTMDINGGPAERLTYQGTNIHSLAWNPSGTSIRYSSDHHNLKAGDYHLWEVPADGGRPERLPWGRGLKMAEAEDGTVVISRGHPSRGAAYHKRYRGGTAGHLWIKLPGDSEFRRMTELDGYIESPCFVGERLYFVSDSEGYGNVYSVKYDGTDLRRHSDHADFYARGLSTDGSKLVYHAGGQLYLVDPAVDEPRPVDSTIPSTESRKARRFVDSVEFLQHIAPSYDGKRLAVATRGKLFNFHTFDGPVLQLGERDGTAYRLPTWLAEDNHLLALASDKQTEEYPVLFDADGNATRIEGVDEVGRIIEIIAFPKGKKVAFADHRGSLFTLDLESGEAAQRIAYTPFGNGIRDLAVSPDGKWLAYACGVGTPDGYESMNRTEVHLYDIDSGVEHQVMDNLVTEYAPSFDPQGKYLYVISNRDFNASYDTIDFDLHFAEGARPYAVVLDSQTPAPFVPTGADKADDEEDSDAESEVEVKVDINGLRLRAVALPVEPSGYEAVFGANGKVFTLSRPPKPSSAAAIFQTTPPADGVLQSIDVTTGKVETFADNVTDAWLSADHSTLVYRSGNRFRSVASDAKVPEGDAVGRDTGWVDIGRVTVSVRPTAEWPQMFAEAWRLQRDHFWLEDVGGVDWNEVFERYAPLAERVGSRAEFSDLLWEVQGEVGTSHAYELLGDYGDADQYPVGSLAAEYEYDERAGRWTIASFAQGDTWAESRTSPLTRPGVNVEPGDYLLAVDGQELDADTPPEALLVNRAGSEIQLTVQHGSEEPRRVMVRPLPADKGVFYRDWVEKNREAVHKATDGRVGYLHIPDMSADGFAEFYRGLMSEIFRHALIVDMRFNGGGHVSQLLWDRLEPKRLAHAVSKDSRPSPFNAPKRRGPMVALANEHSGSDGDIGPLTFRERGMGPVIGTRTWGGVVGINPRFRLSDGTMVTQPEVAIRFNSVGFGVENYGVDPDITVEYTPDDFASGVDRQLQTAIETVVKQLAEDGYDKIEIDEYPSVTPPELGPRPQDRR
ncbi:S41 family peptidase [Haloglycomyces albus]|uniref:S41 family peptidase n=1 Tax=Haloglycomyces albus TaxID=526067 RepID=UPI00046CAADD|nr:S41 family peptidase [Haloglycomyces albus]